MAQDDFGGVDRTVIGVNPQAELPARPPVVGPLAVWSQKLGQTLRTQFARFGFAINANSLSIDRDRLRSRFMSKDG